MELHERTCERSHTQTACLSLAVGDTKPCATEQRLGLEEMVVQLRHCRVRRLLVCASAALSASLLHNLSQP